jgi:hypothetical protein
MRRSWNRPGLSRHAIIALVAILLLVLQGMIGAARASSSMRSSAVAASADHGGARICHIDGRSGGAPAAPHGSHCPNDCCTIGSGPSAVFLLQSAILASGAARRDEGLEFSHAPRAPPRASGWASSWSSRAPPLG